MERINKIPLFDPKSAQYILGCLMHTPNLIQTDKYILTVDDFNENNIYKLIFGSIYNLSFAGLKIITPQDIDISLSSVTNSYDNYIKENGKELVELIYEMTEEYDIAQFEYCYERIKKFSILRELRKNGIDIKSFYNPDFLNQEEEEIKFNKLTTKDILNSLRNKIQLIENKNVSKQADTSHNASVGMRDLFNYLKLNPEVGIPFEGQYIYSATRGCRKGKFYLYSAPSGGGKTRTMLENACAIAFPYIDGSKIYYRQQHYPVLFIATEMTYDEIQTLILAHISGVNESKILLGQCDLEETYRINKALEILESEEFKNNFIIECIPNPSIQLLKSMITNYILNEDIEYIFYDYIFSSPGLLDEYRSINLREDVMLMMLSNTLKEIAATYNVFVMSGTQLNGTWEGKCARNANMLRGSKAIADKIDVGMIGVKLDEDELQMVEIISQEKGTPNIVIDIYKNRRGAMCNIKVFKYFDYGTCRTKDLFVTTQNYKTFELTEILQSIPIIKDFK